MKDFSRVEGDRCARGVCRKGVGKRVQGHIPFFPAQRPKEVDSREKKGSQGPLNNIVAPTASPQSERERSLWIRQRVFVGEKMLCGVAGSEGKGTVSRSCLDLVFGSVRFLGPLFVLTEGKGQSK